MTDEPLYEYFLPPDKFVAVFGCDPDEDHEPLGTAHIYPESLKKEFDPFPLVLPSFIDMWGDIFEEEHQENRGKYKIGELVTYIGKSLPEFQGHEFRIRASNVQDKESTEYLLDGDFPYLVWEEEIQRNPDCQCSEKTLESYGCMCKKRIQPG